ncbi:MAG: pirin family protein [Thiolinea sp.]
MQQRHIAATIPGIATSDGAGVSLVRSLGQNAHSRFDPFLMLDHFSSDDPDDYIAGFPPHPHRGFETVTYMLHGKMLHRDHMGNEGLLTSGGVQWMTAGRGVIHEERPQQEQGLLSGFQLWVNLPGKDKMQPARYQNLEPEQIPEITTRQDCHIRLIAGELTLEGETYQGAVNGIAVNPLFADISLSSGQCLTIPVDETLSAFVYLFEGSGSIAGKSLVNGANLLSAGDNLTLEAGKNGLRVLLIAGRAINEPIEQYGPFVMNTRQEIEQALRDYRAGVLTGD